jgi:membrane protease YdiL (CAAX protease family)
LLTYAISWTCWILVILISPITGLTLGLEIVVYAGLFGPAISAFVVNALEGGKPAVKELISRITKWRVGFWWLLVSLFVPIGLYLCAGLTYFLITGNSLEVSTSNLLDVLLLFLYSLFLSGGLEEPGWRGFALPRLQKKLSATKATLVLAFLWVFWHLPLFGLPGYVVSGGSIIGLVLLGIPVAFIFSWIYNNTNSVLLSIIVHAMINFLADFLLPPATDQLFGLLYLAFLWVVAILLVGIYGGATLTKHPQTRQLK